MRISEAKIGEAPLRVLQSGRGMSERIGQDGVVRLPENAAVARRFDALPHLYEGEHRLRYSPDLGSVLIQSWRENTEATYPKIVYRRINESKAIEPAIQLAGHVISAYDKVEGERVAATKKVINEVKNDLVRFEAELPPQEDELEAMKSNMVMVLEDTGFLDARKPIRKEAAEQLQRGASGKDRSGRKNPLIARVVLASAWVKLTRELLVGRQIREKYDHLQLLLLQERELERFVLSQARDSLAKLSHMPSGTRASKGELAVEVPRIAEFMKKYMVPNIVKVNPYLFPAFVVRSSLFGTRFEKPDEEREDARLARQMEEYMEEYGVADLAGYPLNRFTQPGRDTKEEDIAEVQRRAGGGVQVLSAALSRGDGLLVAA